MKLRGGSTGLKYTRKGGTIKHVAKPSVITRVGNLAYDNSYQNKTGNKSIMNN